MGRLDANEEGARLDGAFEEGREEGRKERVMVRLELWKKRGERGGCGLGRVSERGWQS